MKKLLFFAFLLAPFFASAQNTFPEEYQTFLDTYGGEKAIMAKSDLNGEELLDNLESVQMLLTVYTEVGMYKETENLASKIVGKLKLFPKDDFPMDSYLLYQATLIGTYRQTNREKEAIELENEMLQFFYDQTTTDDQKSALKKDAKKFQKAHAEYLNQYGGETAILAYAKLPVEEMIKYEEEITALGLVYTDYDAKAAEQFLIGIKNKLVSIKNATRFPEEFYVTTLSYLSIVYEKAGRQKDYQKNLQEIIKAYAEEEERAKKRKKEYAAERKKREERKAQVAINKDPLFPDKWEVGSKDLAETKADRLYHEAVGAIYFSKKKKEGFDNLHNLYVQLKKGKLKEPHLLERVLHTKVQFFNSPDNDKKSIALLKEAEEKVTPLLYEEEDKEEFKRFLSMAYQANASPDELLERLANDEMTLPIFEDEDDEFISKEMQEMIQSNMNNSSISNNKVLSARDKIFTLMGTKDATHFNFIKATDSDNEIFSKFESYYKKATQNDYFLLSEKEQYQAYLILKNFLFYHISKLNDQSADLNPVAGDFLNQILKVEQLNFAHQLSIKTTINAKKNSKAKAAFKKYVTQKEKISNLHFVPAGQLMREKISIQKEELVLDKLEKDLKKLLRFDTDLNQHASWQSIQSSLQEKQAAIKILRTPHFKKKGMADSFSYLAFIIKKNGTPKIVQLNDGPKMERIYYLQYKSESSKTNPSTQSYTHFWNQIQEQIQGTSKIFLQPDGIYYRINLNTLPLPNARRKYLVDQLDIHLINDFTKINANESNQTKGDYVLVGYPKYDEKSPINESDSKAIYRSGAAGTYELPSNWIDLPGSLNEVDSISKILKRANLSVKVLKEEQANEDNIKALRHPKILHFATHGFYSYIDLSDINRLFNKMGESGEMDFLLNADINFTIKDTSSTSKDGKELNIFNLGSAMTFANLNLDLKSGIVLSGANAFAKAKNKTGLSDGILTGYDINGLDLSGTELVIFSACESGLGKLALNCQTAGAQSLISSIWKVRDDVTQKFMVHFYTNWLEKGMDKREAFRAAQAAIRRVYPEPYLWGGFTMIGG